MIYQVALLVLCAMAILPRAEAAPPGAAPQPSPPVVRGFVGRPDDAARMKEWGANVIRVFIEPRFGLAKLEENVKKVQQLGGVKIVLTTIARGSAGWNDPARTEKLCMFWKDVATRLAPYRDVIWGYDILNEPLDRAQLPLPPRQWRGVALKIIAAIRTVDPETWIIYEVGPAGMFAGFKNLEPLPDKRVIYSAHYYCPHEFTHAGVNTVAGTTEAMKRINVEYPLAISGLRQSAWELGIFQKPPMSIPKELCKIWDKEFQRLVLTPAVEFQKKYGVPIYVGEFSAVRWAPVDALERYLREAIELFEENGWSWSFHCFNGWTGWNPEHPEGPDTYWRPGMPQPKPAAEPTRREQLLREAFKKNRQ